MRYFVVQTSTVFNFLSQQNLLVPFLQENTLADLTKEDLLIVVEKLLNPTHVAVTQPQQDQVLQQEEKLVIVNNVHRTKTVKLSLQEVYDRLVNDGLCSNGNMGKNLINTSAVNLGIIKKRYNGTQAQYAPTEYGEQLGVTKRNAHSVWYTLEAYDIVKDVLLSRNIIKH